MATRTEDFKTEYTFGQERPPRRFTVRSFVVGAALSLFISIAAPYSDAHIMGSWMAGAFSNGIALFLLFILVAILNPLLKLIRKGIEFEATELVTIYIMMIVASSIVAVGLTEHLLPTIVGVYYFATPENDWVNLIHPYIPDWISPSDPEYINYFYEGLPRGEAMPWGIWIGPLLYWSSFAIALYFVMICMMVILRRQWVERERVIYPFAQTPMEMIGDDKSGYFAPFFKNPVMWLGFAIPFIIDSINSLHGFYPFIPRIDVWSSMSIFRNTIRFSFATIFHVIGFVYLIPRDVALAIWSFSLFANVEQGIFNIIGLQETRMTSIYISHWTSNSPYLLHQGMGAMIAFVMLGLWTGREHLKGVLRKAFKNDPNVDDSDEILSYRSAFFGMVAGLLFMTFWLWASGIPLWIVPVFLFGAFVVYTAMTRVVAEGGMPDMRPPMLGADFVITGLGTSVLGPKGLVALGHTLTWHGEMRTFVMASCANGLKLINVVAGNRRPLFWAMMLSIVLSLAGSMWIVLYLAYEEGGINLYSWFFGGAPKVPFIYITLRVKEALTPDIGGWIATGVGASVMGLLTFIRYRFIWWPIHPIGYVITPVFLINQLWFSVFLAWFLKVVILKYGGAAVFRKTRPFFLGLILGQMVVTGTWLIIEFFTGMRGNGIRVL